MPEAASLQFEFAHGNIPHKFLMKSEFLVPLYRLFQTIFNAGLVPTIW